MNIDAAEHQGVHVRLALDFLLRGIEYRHHPMIGKGGRHKKIVCVVVAVRDVQDNLVYHKEFLGVYKDVQAGLIYHPRFHFFY